VRIFSTGDAALRSGKKKFSIPSIVFITQMGTMVLIGLWHGVTWNFVAWACGTVWAVCSQPLVGMDQRRFATCHGLAEGFECRRRAANVSFCSDRLGILCVAVLNGFGPIFAEADPLR